MAREVTYYGQSKNGDFLFLPFYGVSSCAVNIIRADNTDGTGDIQALNVIPKLYAYDSQLYNFDNPSAVYGFPTADQSVLQGGYFFALSTGGAPRESLSGRLLTLTGGNITAGNYTVARLQGKYMHVPPTVIVTDVAAPILTPLENAGSPWAVSAWVFRTGATFANVYVEANTGITNYFQLGIQTTGALTIGTHTGIKLTSTNLVPLNAWTHIAYVYTGTQVIFYVGGNGVAPVAYAHQTGLTGQDRRILNNGATGVLYTQSLAVFGHTLAAGQVNRQFYEIFGNDFYSGGAFSQGAAMSQGGSFQVVYTNGVIPQSLAPNTSLVSAVLPLQGIGLIRFLGTSTTSVYSWEIHAEELEAA
jgi:hypothetical protein